MLRYLPQYLEPVLRANPVQRDEDADGLVDHRMRTNRLPQLRNLSPQPRQCILLAGSSQGPLRAERRHHQLSQHGAGVCFQYACPLAELQDLPAQ
ncbi:hypothetical protein GCM10010228_69310 [Streptomyces massasporeus]|nr:hypothetical protein GCM10010228_69310 [Streptomyces massasporeus]